MNKILVTGATGNVGSHLVDALRGRGEPGRAFVRDAGKARALLGEDVELAVGDYGDPTSIAAALDGVDRVFLLTPTHPEMVQWEQNILNAAAAAGVRRVVKMSTLGADPESDARFARWQGRCEQLLKASGIPAVILRSSNHMTNLLFSAASIRDAGKIFAPMDDAKIAMIDRRDLAAVAALTLTEDGHDGRTYALTGPEALTYHDVATQLSQVLGRTVQFVDVPDEAAIGAALQAGVPEWLAHGIIEVDRQQAWARGPDDRGGPSAAGPRAIRLHRIRPGHRRRLQVTPGLAQLGRPKLVLDSRRSVTDPDDSCSSVPRRTSIASASRCKSSNADLARSSKKAQQDSRLWRRWITTANRSERLQPEASS
jgi:uncharacterized protein YbjT (DUF2867 family)